MVTFRVWNTSTMWLFKALKLAAFLIAFVELANARLCPVPVLNMYNSPKGFNLQGIGDGCTLSGMVNGHVVSVDQLGSTKSRMAHRFKDTFHNACVRHDQCLTQIGSVAEECHAEFDSLMRQACDAAFKWYKPVDRLMCRETGKGFTDFARRMSSQRVANHFQQASLVASRALQTRVETLECGSSPARSGLFSSGLLASFNSTFQAHSGRRATVFEEFALLNRPEVITARSSWLQSIERYAQSQRNTADLIPVASMEVNREVGLSYSIKKSDPRSVTFTMLNGVSFGGSTDLFLAGPVAFNEHVRLQGFVFVASPQGVRNIYIIDQTVLNPGTCGRRRGQACF